MPASPSIAAKAALDVMEPAPGASRSGDVPATDYLPDWVEQVSAGADRSTLEFMRLAEGMFKRGEEYNRRLAAMAFPPLTAMAAWGAKPDLVNLLRLQLELAQQMQSLWLALLRPPPVARSAAAD